MSGRNRRNKYLSWAVVVLLLVSCLELSFASVGGAEEDAAVGMVSETEEQAGVAEEALPGESQQDGTADPGDADGTVTDQETPEDSMDVPEENDPGTEDAAAEQEGGAEEAGTQNDGVRQQTEGSDRAPAAGFYAPLAAYDVPIAAPQAISGIVDPAQIADMTGNGITVNIFDYDLTDTIDTNWSSASATDGRNNYGINNGHSLKFFQNGLDHANVGTDNAYPQGQDYNNWTGSPVYTAYTDASGYHPVRPAYANQGIVANKLDENGYPVMASALPVGAGESLAYLFDPDAETPDRAVYQNVDGLLKIVGNPDTSHKLEYNCADNYAYLDTATGQFTLYEGTYYCGYQGVASEANGPIGFFPFNAPDTTQIEIAGHNTNAGGGHYNHHFGMTMDASFAITSDGMLGGAPMTFEFAGDDDMWVFIDGVLVLDIGGIHQPVAAQINFKDGTVSMHEAPIYDGQNATHQMISGAQSVLNGTVHTEADGRGSFYYDTNGNQVYVNNGDMTLPHIFELAGETWDPTPYKMHRIQCFYLERGGMYSNLDISMNLLMTKDIEVAKELVDAAGNVIEDLSAYNVTEDTTFGFKVLIKKEGSDEYFAYTGEDGAEGSGVYGFGGYEVYQQVTDEATGEKTWQLIEDDPATAESEVPQFDENGVIQLTRSQKLKIIGMPNDRQYKVVEADVSKEMISETRCKKETGEETAVAVTKTDKEGNVYDAETAWMVPKEKDLTTIQNVPVLKPQKKEVSPYQGNDSWIPDPDHPAGSLTKDVENEAGVLGPVKVGQEIEYEISYTNYLTAPANIVINDPLDPGVDFVSASEGYTLTPASGSEPAVVSWVIEGVQPGGSGTVTLKVKVNDKALEEEGTVVNEASVKVGNEPALNTDPVTNPAADPHKTETAPYQGNDEKIPDPEDPSALIDNEDGELGPVNEGDEITYQIEYKNYQTKAASVVITDPLDPNVEVVPGSISDNGSVSTVDGRDVVTWTIQDVAAGTSGSVTFKGRVKEGAKTVGKVVNTASVQVADDPAVDTETVTNPVADVPVKEETAPYQGTGELGAVQPGQAITYSVSYKNYRTKMSTVTITDPLDENVEFVSAPAGEGYSAGSYDAATHTVTWTIDNVDPGAAGAVTLNVKVRDDASVKGEVIHNKATVKVSNDAVYETNEVTNPVPEDPHKKETAPYQGTGLLGGVSAGDEISYEITYKNYKSSAADVVITDPLDPNVEFVSAPAGTGYSAGSYDAATHTVTWTLGSVPADTEGSVTLKVKVKEGVKGELVNNKASVKVGNDPSQETEEVTNPTSTDPVKAEPNPGDDVAVRVGDQIDYEISYDNYHPVPATVVVTDRLDPYVELVPSSLADNASYDPQTRTITWTIENVPKHGDEGSTGKVSFSVTVQPGAAASEKKLIENKAAVKVGNDPAVDTNIITNPVPEDPEKIETAPFEGTGVLGGVKPGQEITYKITYKNYKSQPANVTITDSIDSNAEFVSASNGGTNDGGQVTWTIGNVPAGEEGFVTLTVKVRADAQGETINNKAVVKVGNDSEYETNEVENPVPENPVKEELEPYEGTGALGGVKPGEEITYEVSYKNYKKNAADVVITDPLDPNVTFVEASNGGTASTSDGVTTVSWTIQNVAAGEEGSVTLTVKVNDDAAGQMVRNKAYVNVGNDGDFETEEVTNPVPETPKKVEIAPYEGTGNVPEEELGAVRPGDEITYHIQYKNYKDIEAAVRIYDPLDANVGFVSAVPGASEEEGVPASVYDETMHAVAWTIPNVAAGESGTVTLTVKVKADAAGTTVKNHAVVKVGNDAEFTTNVEKNPVPEDPHKAETAPYQGTGLLGGVQAGDSITYGISYKNYRSEAATVVITDPLDPNVTFDSAPAGSSYSAGSYDEASHTVIWTIDNVEPGAEGTVTLTVKVNEGVKGELVNNQAVVKVGSDPEFLTEVVTNPTTTDPVKAEPRPGADVAVRPGDTVQYEVSYDNYRPEAATVTIRDELDANVTPVADSISDNGVYDETSHTITWTLENIPAHGEEGAAGKVSFSVIVGEGALESNGGPGEIENDAFVQVSNDPEVKTNVIENPVPEDPVKTETAPGEDVGVKPGDTIEYRISYENYRKEAAAVTVTDTLDEGLDYVSAEPAAYAAYDEATRTVTWEIPDVEAGKADAVTLTVKVNEAAKADDYEVVNSAGVQVAHDPVYWTDYVENPVPENPVKLETAPYEGTGEEAVEQLGAVRPGDLVTYTVSYKNYKQAAADIVITDPLDPNVRFVEASGSGQWSGESENGGTVIWTIEDVAAGDAGTVTLTVEVLDSALEAGMIDNQAAVNVANDGDFETNIVENPVPEDPVKEETAPYEGTGELGAVWPGEQITYKISYKNYKNVAADVTITDRLDPNVTFESASDNGEEADGTVTWTIEGVEAGAEGSVTLTVTVNESAKGELVSNKAVVKVGNDADYETNEVSNPVPPDPVKAETMPGEGIAVRPGETISYQIHYSNYYPDPAKVVITDALDPQVTVDEESISAGGTYDAEAHMITWTLEDVPARGEDGSSGTVSFSVVVKADAQKSAGGTGIIENEAGVTVGDDPEVRTNRITNPVPDDPTKTETRPGNGKGVGINDTIEYEISYENYEEEAATVVVTDVLDEGLDYVSAGPQGIATYFPQSRTVIWTIEDVPAGESGKVTLTVQVNGKATANDATVLNTAEVQVGNNPVFGTNTVKNPVNQPPRDDGRKTKTGDDSVAILVCLAMLTSAALMGAMRRRRKNS